MPPPNQGACLAVIRQVANASGIRLSDVRATQILSKISNWASQIAQAQSITYMQALQQAAQSTIAQMQYAQALSQRAKILDFRAQKNLMRHAEIAANKGSTYGAGIQDFLEGEFDSVVRTRWKREYGAYVAELEQNGLLDAELSGKYAQEIFLELYNLDSGGKTSVTGVKTAFDIAKIQMNSKARIDALLVRSGEIPTKLTGHGLPQTWSHERLMSLAWNPATKRHEASLGLAKFKALVWDLMDDTQTLKGANKDDFIKHFWDNIYTNEFNSGSVVNGLSKEPSTGSLGVLYKQRRMIFKDGASALEANKVLGEFGPKEGFLRYLQEATAHSARLEYLGPNPAKNFERVKAELSESAKGSGSNAGSEDKLRQVQSLRENFQGQKLDMAFRIASGAVDFAADPRLARTIANAQAVMVLGAQGSTIISAVTSDPFLATMTATRHGFSAMATVARGAVHLLGGGRDAYSRRALNLAGIGTEGLAGLAAARYSQFDRGSKFLGRLVEGLFKYQGLTWWTDTWRRSYADMLMSSFGEVKGRTLSDLEPDMQDLLRYHGFDDVDWSLIQATAQKHPHFDVDWTIGDLTNPAVAGNLDPASVALAKARYGPDWAHKLEERYARLIHDEVYTAVMEPGAMEKKYTTFGMKSGTVLGSLVRVFTFLKSYAIGVSARHLSAEWHKASPLRGAILIAGGIATGYLSMLIRDTLNGKTPRPLYDKEEKFQYDLITDSLQRGGVLGFWGDLFLQEYNAYTKNLGGYLLGPAGQKLLDPGFSAFTKVRQGEVPDDEIGKLGGLIPFNNFIGARQAYDHTIGWTLQEWAFPGAKSKAKSNLKRIHGQEYYDWAGPEN